VLTAVAAFALLRRSGRHEAADAAARASAA
jgi:hypothetical protein